MDVFKLQKLQEKLRSEQQSEILANLKEDDSMGVLTKDDKIQCSNSCSHVKGIKQLARSVKTGDHKVLLIGDSHAKKCALDLRHNLEPNYEVCGFVKPGAISSEIIKTAEKEVSSLKQEDVVILWTGANDINRNNSKDALKNLSCFMSANNEVNMILINSLLRHDLMPTSCVNKEVNKFNRQLKKIVKLHGNVKLLNVEVQREHFTRHGQHLNNKGKELVSLELSRLVKQCLKKESPAPVQMQWKEEKSDIHNKIVQNLEPVLDRDSDRDLVELTGSSSSWTDERDKCLVLDEDNFKYCDPERAKDSGGGVDNDRPSVLDEGNKEVVSLTESTELNGPLETSGKRNGRSRDIEGLIVTELDDTPDKRIRRKPVTRSTDFLWEG